MRTFKNTVLSLLFVFVFLVSACAPAAGTDTSLPGPTGDASSSLYKITGGFTVSNDFVISTYMVEHAVALVDMHAFVIRDMEWEIPVKSQVLGFLDVDLETSSGQYELYLPVLPQGEFNDIDNNSQADAGVQIFAVSYWPNLYGGVYSEGDDRSRGWPSYLASIRTDTENEDEVIGGKLVIWAADDKQQFSTDFGPDGLLFTADDPVASVAAGYSIVDLDTKPFSFIRSAEAELTLYEPSDVAAKDFSTLSYTESFDKMFDFVRTNYAFNGIAGKQPEWDALYAQLKPRVEQAEKDRDKKAYFFAIQDFTLAFKDGHVGMNGGNDFFTEDFQQNTSGGYGFSLRELYDGRVLVMFVTPGGPAEKAGMKLGALVTEFNGQPISTAIGAVVPRWVMPISSDFSLRYQQQRYLLRAPLGTEATVTFTNPDGQVQTVTLTTVNERDSFTRTSVYFNVDSDYILPVESRLIDEGNAQVGYVRINANYDDLNLIIRLFERALKEFEVREVAGLIIDMRFNSGGAPLGLAGFLTDQEFVIGQSEYYSETTLKFEPEGTPDKVLPNENQYRFDKMVLLVGQACFSACEWESYAFSQVPGMITVGQYPTGGVFAEVARGQINLPDGLSVQVPTGRTIMPDGSIFLEGKGVQPTVRVPVDESTVYREDDFVLEYGIKAIFQPLGAGITPARQPTLMSAADTDAALSSGAKFFEDKAREQYTNDELLNTDNVIFPYTITLNKSEKLIWLTGWCAKDSATLKDNLSKMKYVFSLNGKNVPVDAFMKLEDIENGGQRCTYYALAVTDWAAGENHAITTLTFTAPINDGAYDFAAGSQTSDYAVFVKP